MIYSFTKRWEQGDKRKGWQKSSRRRRWYRTHSVDGMLMLLVVPLGGPLLTVNRGRRWIMKRGMELGIYCSLSIFQFGTSSISADTEKNSAPPESIRPVALLLWPIENLTTIDNESSRTSDVVYAQCPQTASAVSYNSWSYALILNYLPSIVQTRPTWAKGISSGVQAKKPKDRIAALPLYAL